MGLGRTNTTILKLPMAYLSLPTSKTSLTEPHRASRVRSNTVEYSWAFASNVYGSAYSLRYSLSNSSACNANSQFTGVGMVFSKTGAGSQWGLKLQRGLVITRLQYIGVRLKS